MVSGMKMQPMTERLIRADPWRNHTSHPALCAWSHKAVVAEALQIAFVKEMRPVRAA